MLDHNCVRHPDVIGEINYPGFVDETYSRPSYPKSESDIDVVQDNYSLSNEVGIWRELHFLMLPCAQKTGAPVLACKESDPEPYVVVKSDDNSLINCITKQYPPKSLIRLTGEL